MIKEELVQLILVILLFAGLFILFANGIHQDKVNCISNGGKWISGYVGGNYSAFCIPK
jgi:hypothetical protein